MFCDCFDERSSSQTSLSFILLSAKLHLLRCSSSSHCNALRLPRNGSPFNQKGSQSCYLFQIKRHPNGCLFSYGKLCDSLIFRPFRTVAKNLRCSRLHSSQNLSQFCDCFDERFCFAKRFSVLLPVPNKKTPKRVSFYLELMTGIEPVNLILTKDALYRLSYISIKPCYCTSISDSSQ